MAQYTPIKITGYSTGLVQDRQEMILPNDAYPVLRNAYIFRERIQRKQGVETIGRFQRNFVDLAAGSFDAFGIYTINLITFFGLESTASIVPGSISVVVANNTFTDINPFTPTVPANGNIFGNGGNLRGTILYNHGAINITYVPSANLPATISFSYYPGLPVMGVLKREINRINFSQTVFFDTKYAYRFDSSTSLFTEFIPGFTWSGTDYNLFWPMNYWVTPSAPKGNNEKLFWVTNFSGTAGDPIRYSAFDQDPTVWIDFAPTINAAGDKLNQCLAMLPFRGRMVVFNTLEGTNLASSIQYFQRIRWAAIGNPISDVSSLFPAGTVNVDAWRDDKRGQGGFLDIPTSESIVSVGFVRDNLVIYCESSTWQLRYTGRSIAPFQIERVNAELGSESTFSAIQFDKSLVGIGNKGVVQCDSYQSEQIDIKIPDLVFGIHNIDHGNERVYGIRDFENRLAYWIYPEKVEDLDISFPNRRLVYNYENDSWAIFQDSFTALGYFQTESAYTWANQSFTWEQANFPWIGKPALFPFLCAGNQQGYVFRMDQLTVNQRSLYISDIVGGATATVIQCIDHNLETDQVIQIVNMSPVDTFYVLNNGIYAVGVVDKDNFEIFAFNSNNQDFSDAVVVDVGVYIGMGEIIVRDGFSIQSKKFNFLDDGQNIQLGFIDILMNATTSGAITLNVYADYNDTNPINTKPKNLNVVTQQPDTFFNSVIPTSVPIDRASSKNWQRVFCPSRAAFLTLEYTLSPAQLNGEEQESDVQIDAQILWIRKAGRQLPIGV